MILKVMEDEYCVCKLSDVQDIDLDNSNIFVGITDDEISLVCREVDRPKEAVSIEAGYSLLKIQGVLDFSLIGIISKISTILADNRIGIFVVSTFNTDYFLVKSTDLQRTKDALLDNGYTFL